MRTWIVVAGATTALLGCPSDNNASLCADTDVCGGSTTSGDDSQTMTTSLGSTGETTAGSTSNETASGETTASETTSSETGSQDDTSDTGQAETSSTGEPDLCEREDFDEAPAAWTVTGMGAAVDPTFEDSALVLDVTTDGGDFAFVFVQSATRYELSNVAISAGLLELPQSSGSLSSDFGLLGDPGDPGVAFSIGADSVQVTESTGFGDSTVLGSVPLSRVQLPLVLEFTFVGDTLSAGVSGPGGEQIIYEGPTPEGLLEAGIVFGAQNLSSQDPTGVTLFDFVEVCPI